LDDLAGLAVVQLDGHRYPAKGSLTDGVQEANSQRAAGAGQQLCLAKDAKVVGSRP
jgi:hypothetical protein